MNYFMRSLLKQKSCKSLQWPKPYLMTATNSKIWAFSWASFILYACPHGGVTILHDEEMATGAIKFPGVAPLGLILVENIYTLHSLQDTVLDFK
jgi:hypothetical protein